MTQYDPKPSWSLKRRSISVRSDPSRFRRRSIGPRALGIDNNTIGFAQDERFINRRLCLFSYDCRYQQNASVARSRPGLPILEKWQRVPFKLTFIEVTRITTALGSTFARRLITTGVKI
jgi:hypothetical protein